MANDLNLTAVDIYEKEFHIDVKGYVMAEVDEYLDKIIDDYQNYDERLQELGQAISRYEQKTKELQQEVFALQQENDSLTEQIENNYVSGNTDQVDLLKRIARLEEAVFKTPEKK